MRRFQTIRGLMMIPGIFVAASAIPASAHHEGELLVKVVLIYPMDALAGILGLAAPVLANADLARGGSRAKGAVAGLYVTSALNGGAAAVWLAGTKPGGERTGFAIAHIAIATLDLGFAIWATQRCCGGRKMVVSPIGIPVADSRSPAMGVGLTVSLP